MKRHAVLLGIVAGLSLLSMAKLIVDWTASTAMVKTTGACSRHITRMVEIKS